MNKYCFILPCYQHAFTLKSIVSELAKWEVKIFVVNDGSDQKNTTEMRAICSKEPLVELLEHPQNEGKGAAVRLGLEVASSQGYTHGIQIDSDGQHDLNVINQLLTVSKKFPGDLISGRPIYDQSVPKLRLYGRYATHIWVWIETLSLQIRDSMCGFRVYPLVDTLEVMRDCRVGKRMDFDSEIMVRLFWKGLNIHHVPVAVKYPENGISHFHVWRDNVRITKMHVRLFFGMLPRIHKLIFRKRPAIAADSPSWSKIEEYGSTFGIKALMLCYRILGRTNLNLILYFLGLYYLSVSKNAREASADLRRNLKAFTGGRAKGFTTLEHIYSFASSAIDKVAVWAGDITLADLVKEDVDRLLEIAQAKQGAFFLTSHYGNIEICRALGRFYEGVKFNALVYQENAKKFNEYINKVNPASKLNLISVKNVGPELSMILKEKVDNGEWVFVVGDRVSLQDHQRTLAISLLGQKAHVSQGPFILAYLLDVPIYIIHCYRTGEKFRLQLKRVEISIERSKENRTAYIEEIARQYAQELDLLLLADPLQWYNFFDFWKVDC